MVAQAVASMNGISFKMNDEIKKEFSKSDDAVRSKTDMLHMQSEMY